MTPTPRYIEEHLERLALHSQGLNDTEIATKLGYSEKQVIQSWRTRYKIPANAKRGWQKPGPGRSKKEKDKGVEKE